MWIKVPVKDEYNLGIETYKLVNLTPTEAPAPGLEQIYIAEQQETDKLWVWIDSLFNSGIAIYTGDIQQCITVLDFLNNRLGLNAKYLTDYLHNYKGE